MGASIPIPTLSAAEIMADLDSLYECDPSTAISLLNASMKISPIQIRRRSRASILPEPPKFDNLGKRIVSVPSLSRINSDSSEGMRGSELSTASKAALESPYEKDENMRRAKELVTLFEKKDSVRQLGTAGLGKAKRKVDTVVEKYTSKQLEVRERAARGRHLDV